MNLGNIKIGTNSREKRRTDIAHIRTHKKPAGFSLGKPAGVAIHIDGGDGADEQFENF